MYNHEARRFLRPVYVHPANGNSKTRTTAALSIGVLLISICMKFSLVVKQRSLDPTTKHEEGVCINS